MSNPNAYGAAAYANVKLETAVATANPHQLVIMLYDGAIQALANARHHMGQGDIAGKAKNIGKAVDIVNKGLNASLDPVMGGELAADLKALYDYMCRRLVMANLQNDIAAVEEVRGLLIQLRGAWAAIADSPAAQTAPRHISGSLTA